MQCGSMAWALAVSWANAADMFDVSASNKIDSKERITTPHERSITQTASQYQHSGRYASGPKRHVVANADLPRAVRACQGSVEARDFDR